MSFELAIQKLIHKKYDDTTDFFCDISGYCENCCNQGHCLDINNYSWAFPEEDSTHMDGLEYIDHPFFRKSPFTNPGYNDWPV